MGFKAAASELGTEGGLRTRTDTDTVKAKSIRIRTYPYALETCLPLRCCVSDSKPKAVKVQFPTGVAALEQVVLRFYWSHSG